MLPGDCAMVIVVAVLLMVYGYSHIYHKDFWWWDAALLWERLNRPMHRTESWDRQQDWLGLLCMSAGVFLLVWFAAGSPA